jgi:hypothetical protein
LHLKPGLARWNLCRGAKEAVEILRFQPLFKRLPRSIGYSAW